MDNSVLEKKIKETLEKKAEAVRVNGLASQRFRAAVYERIEEEADMKHRNWKKTILAAAAICVLGSMTAIAVARPAFLTGSSSMAEAVYDYETARSMQEGYDGSVKTVEEFSNGYQFRYAVPEYGSSQDENYQTLDTETTMNFIYGKEGLPDVTLFNSRLSAPSESADETMVLEDGTELRYSRLANKFVPPDYEPTEEEVKLQEEGKLNIGYGSDEIQETVSVHVSWSQDGVTYSLLTFNENMGAEEMFQMAKEVAESR